jgi:hypothetical protein
MAVDMPHFHFRTGFPEYDNKRGNIAMNSVGIFSMNQVNVLTKGGVLLGLS